jgi:hypothetical protein
MFQVGLWVSGGYDFFQHMVLLTLLLLFLVPDWWQRRLSAREGMRGAPGLDAGARVSG